MICLPLLDVLVSLMCLEFALSMALAIHAALSMLVFWLPWVLNLAESFFFMFIVVLPIDVALLE